MSFNSNNVYISPTTGGAVSANVYNYLPENPCIISDVYNEITLEYKPYNPRVYNSSLNQSINFANAVANQAQAVLTKDATAITFTQQTVKDIQDNVNNVFVNNQN